MGGHGGGREETRKTSTDVSRMVHRQTGVVFVHLQAKGKRMRKEPRRALLFPLDRLRSVACCPPSLSPSHRNMRAMRLSQEGLRVLRCGAFWAAGPRASALAGASVIIPRHRGCVRVFGRARPCDEKLCEAVSGCSLPQPLYVSVSVSVGASVGARARCWCAVV